MILLHPWPHFTPASYNMGCGQTTRLSALIPKSLPYLACTFRFRRGQVVTCGHSAAVCMSREAHVSHREAQHAGSRPAVVAEARALPEDGGRQGRRHGRLRDGRQVGGAHGRSPPPSLPHCFASTGTLPGGSFCCTFGSCQEVHGLLQNIYLQDKQRMRPPEGSAYGGLGHSTRHISEAREPCLCHESTVLMFPPSLQLPSSVL